MVKRIVSLFAVCVMLCCLLAPAASAAAAEPDVIRLRLHSDVAGCYADKNYEQFLEILSPQVTYRCTSGGPVGVTNAAGVYFDQLEGGRAYSVEYMLTAAEGYTLPDSLADGDIEIECGKGVTLHTCRIVDYYQGKDADGAPIFDRTLVLTAKVVADSSVFRRIIGWIRDVILYIRCWQLY